MLFSCGIHILLQGLYFHIAGNLFISFSPWTVMCVVHIFLWMANVKYYNWIFHSVICSICIYMKHFFLFCFSPGSPNSERDGSRGSLTWANGRKWVLFEPTSVTRCFNAVGLQPVGLFEPTDVGNWPEFGEW